MITKVIFSMIMMLNNNYKVNSFIHSNHIITKTTKTTNRIMCLHDSVGSYVPDIEKRNLMNNILVTSLYGSCGPLLYGYFNFFAPTNLNSNQGGLIAKDKNGIEITSETWLKTHSYPSRDLVQGLKGDPYYLITTTEEGKDKLETYALNAICTHLGCVVPWNVAENKFMCPCHGSQYDNTGKVIRGPAPRSLALANVEEKDGMPVLSQWSEIDFRTNETPWWL